MLTRIVCFCFRIKESQQRPRPRLRLRRRDASGPWVSARESCHCSQRAERLRKRAKVVCRCCFLSHAHSRRAIYICVCAAHLPSTPASTAALPLCLSLSVSLCLSHIQKYPYTQAMSYFCMSWVIVIALVVVGTEVEATQITTHEVINRCCAALSSQQRPHPPSNTRHSQARRTVPYSASALLILSTFVFVFLAARNESCVYYIFILLLLDPSHGASVCVCANACVCISVCQL